MIKSVLFLFLVTNTFIFLTSCKSHLDSNNRTTSERLAQNLSSEGFIKAKIIYDSVSEAPCDYMIKIEDEILLEPLNLSDSLKQGNLNIWIKFQYSRRLSRCKNSVPVVIDEIRVGSP